MAQLYKKLNSLQALHIFQKINSAHSGAKNSQTHRSPSMVAPKTSSTTYALTASKKRPLHNICPYGLQKTPVTANTDDTIIPKKTRLTQKWPLCP